MNCLWECLYGSNGAFFGWRPRRCVLQVPHISSNSLKLASMGLWELGPQTDHFGCSWSIPTPKRKTNITNTSEECDRTSNQEWTRSWNFFNIPTIRNQIAFCQLTYIREIVRRESTHIPTRLRTAWCDHPRKVGRPLLTNKQCIVRNLQLVLPEVDDDGTLASWGFHALDTSFWNTLLRTLKHPWKDPPESPPNTYFPQTNSSANYNGNQPLPPASPRETP